jgi:hypothetical protein
MGERGLPTLADARRQVWVRELIAWLLGGLGLIFLLLFLLKFLYINLPVLLFFFADGEKVRRSIDTFLRAWPVLILLLRAIPPWQPIGTLVITPQWDFVYAVWGVMVVFLVARLLRRSAYRRRAQITTFQDEMQREAWGQQAREARGVAPDVGGTTTVIGPAIWHQYAAPPESFGQSTKGIVILGLIIALVGGIIVGIIVLYAEYAFFQLHWPSGRN